MMTTFNHEQLNDFRRRVIAQEHITEDELRSAVEFLANMRQGAASSTASATPKKAQSPAAKAQATEEARKALGDLLGGL